MTCPYISISLYPCISSISSEYNFSQGFANYKRPTKWYLYDGVDILANAG